MIRREAAGSRRAFQLLTLCGLGHRRPASGTWGSLPVLVFGAALLYPHFEWGWPVWLFHVGMALWVIVFSLACVMYGDHAEARFGRDPSEVVADEAAGQGLTLLLLPMAALENTAAGLFLFVMSFFAFRVMDIFKPWPADRLQRIVGGWGILLDDLAAAVWAAAVMWVVVGVG